MGRDYCVKCDKRMSSSDGTSLCHDCTPVDVEAVQSEARQDLLDEIEKRLEGLVCWSGSGPGPCRSYSQELVKKSRVQQILAELRKGE